jgi:hypothetical protein
MDAHDPLQQGMDHPAPAQLPALHVVDGVLAAQDEREEQRGNRRPSETMNLDAARSTRSNPLASNPLRLMNSWNISEC